MLCASGALAAGMAAAVGVHAADSPGALTHSEWLWDFALSAASVYMAAPLLLLGALMLWGRRMSSGACVGVTLGWYGLVFAAWLASTWLSEGAFPVWGLRHYGFDLLPIPLAMGLVFSMAARAFTGTQRKA
jgi:hypothetical protein